MEYGMAWRDAARWICTAAVAAGIGAGVASAKLPQAPVDDAARAKAENAKAKAGEAAKKEGEQLSKAQDRVADRYKKEKNVNTAATVEPKKK